MLFSLKYLISFLYVSGVAQFILITLFARLFVQYCVSYSFYYFSVVITPSSNIGGGLWIFIELEFPSMESSFV